MKVEVGQFWEIIVKAGDQPKPMRVDILKPIDNTLFDPAIRNFYMDIFGMLPTHVAYELDNMKAALGYHWFYVLQNGEHSHQPFKMRIVIPQLAMDIRSRK